MITRLRSVLESRRASLADKVVLPEPCRPATRITVGGLSARRRGCGLFAAQHVDQAVVDDLDHLVGRLDRADHRFAERLLAGLVDEVAHHRQGDVGLEQGDAHLAHRRVDVLLGQHAAAGKPVEDAGKPIAQTFKHSDLATFSACVRPSEHLPTTTKAPVRDHADGGPRRPRPGLAGGRDGGGAMLTLRARHGLWPGWVATVKIGPREGRGGRGFACWAGGAERKGSPQRHEVHEEMRRRPRVGPAEGANHPRHEVDGFAVIRARRTFVSFVPLW